MTEFTERETMFISTRRTARFAAVVGMAGVLALAVAGPASAATNKNQAFGIRTNGLINAGPFSYSQFPGSPNSNSALSADASPLLTAGVINTQAGANSSSASVADLSVALATLTTLSAQAVGSTCTFNPNTGTVSGATSIVGGSVTLPLLPPIVLATAPAANTAVVVPGVASVILNRQVLNGDGSLTVDAIYISLLPNTPLAQVIRIATSHCHPATLVQIPLVAPAFAVGAGLLGLLGAGFFLARRRRAAADPA